MSKLNKTTNTNKQQLTNESLRTTLQSLNYKLDVIRMGFYNAMVCSNYAETFPVVKEIDKIIKTVNDLDRLSTDLIAGLQLKFEKERG